LRFAIHGPGYPVASSRGHGVPRRDIPGRVHIGIAGISAGHVPGMGTVVPQHVFLGGRGKQPVAEGHTNILSTKADISGEVKRRFFLGLQIEAETPRS